MSQQLKSHSRQARGSTTEALPQQAPLSFAYSTHTQHPWMVVSRALRANYDHQPGPDAVPHWCQRTDAPEMEKPQLGDGISDGSYAAHVTPRRSRRFCARTVN